MSKSKKKEAVEVKYNTKKVILLIIFCLAITIFVFTMLLSFNDFKEIKHVLNSVNIKYLMYAMLFILAYFLLYPITLCILVKSKKINISPLNAYLIGSTEHFFNGITPFATGGQPFQVYAFKQFDVKLSDSSGILVMNFIIFMIVTNIYALVSLFFYPLLAKGVSNLLAMVIIGFGINFFVLLFMIAIATSKKLRHALEAALLWLSRFKCLKKLIEPNLGKFHDYCKQTQTAFAELWHHKGAFFSCFFVRFVTMGIYYATTYFILKALNIDVTPDKIPFIISSTAFAITMCVFIPTPGSSGGIEFAFKSIFQTIAIGITTEVALSGMMLWRLLTYYLVMFISFIIYLVLQHKIVKNYKKNLALESAKLDSEVDDDTGDKVAISEDINISTDACQCNIQGNDCDNSGDVTQDNTRCDGGLDASECNETLADTGIDSDTSKNVAANAEKNIADGTLQDGDIDNELPHDTPISDSGCQDTEQE